MKIEIEFEELIKMMTEHCDYCEFKPGRCSELEGCENGIREFLGKKYEVCDS